MKQHLSLGRLMGGFALACLLASGATACSTDSSSPVAPRGTPRQTVVRSDTTLKSSPAVTSSDPIPPFDPTLCVNGIYTGSGSYTCP